MENKDQTLTDISKIVDTYFIDKNFAKSIFIEIKNSKEGVLSATFVKQKVEKVEKIKRKIIPITDDETWKKLLNLSGIASLKKEYMFVLKRMYDSENKTLTFSEVKKFAEEFSGLSEYSFLVRLNASLIRRTMYTISCMNPYTCGSGRTRWLSKHEKIYCLTLKYSE